MSRRSGQEPVPGAERLIPPPRPDAPPPPPPPSGGVRQGAAELRAELRSERSLRALWELRYRSLEYAVIDAGHDPYLEVCPINFEHCPICAAVRRLRATVRVLP